MVGTAVRQTEVGRTTAHCGTCNGLRVVKRVGKYMLNTAMNWATGHYEATGGYTAQVTFTCDHRRTIITSDTNLRAMGVSNPSFGRVA